MNNPFRNLPSVNDVLGAPSLAVLPEGLGHASLVAAVRAELEAVRQRIRSGVTAEVNAPIIAERALLRVQQETRAQLRQVINATGIVLHTNLGRAPLAEEAARAAYEAGRGYLNLEMDLESGKRSSRQNAIREWVCRLTGAESATAVNNNAAATVIALRALCQGREVVVSRGQLIEIGGSFRIPEIMAVSGAILREVGTTNITRLSDFENAIGPNTAALMQIHTSNYRVSGFTKAVSLPELVTLGKKSDIPVIDDVGSGALIDFGRFGFADEPVASTSIAAGADLVLFSGDKLLGGPQAGILAGRKESINKIEKDPLMRAFRLDKMTLAALEATLRIYLNEAAALERIPCLRMLGASLDDLQQRAQSLAERLRQIGGLASAVVVEDTAYVGGGSLPDQAMKTFVVAIAAKTLSDADLAVRLRTGTPALLGRLRDGKVLLDLRTIFPAQEQPLLDAVGRALEQVPLDFDRTDD